jgi:hypothetical protein
MKARAQDNEVVHRLVQVAIDRKEQCDSDIDELRGICAQSSALRGNVLTAVKFHLQKGFSLFALKILVLLAESSKQFPTEFDQKFVSKLIHYFHSITQDRTFFHLFEILVKSRTLKIDGPLARRLAALGAWPFLQSCLDIPQGEAFSESSLEPLTKVVREGTKIDVTPEYLDFCWQFIRFVNQRAGKITDPHFVVSIVPLDLDERLFHAFETVTPDLVEYAEFGILSLYLKCQNRSLLVKRFLDRLEQCKDDQPLAELVTARNPKRKSRS